MAARGIFRGTEFAVSWNPMRLISLMTSHQHFQFLEYGLSVCAEGPNRFGCEPGFVGLSDLQYESTLLILTKKRIVGIIF